MTMNLQPVVPFALDNGWSLVVRTILPVVSQDDIYPGAGSQFGLGDTLQSFFFVAPPVDGFTLAAGPVLQYPTGTDRLLTTGKWGAGFTFLALYQPGPWTFALLSNHVWSFAGLSGRPNVNNTFLQPVISYAASDGWTFGINAQSTYNWVSNQWSVPLQATVSKLLRVGRLPMSIAAGPKYWVESPEGGPHGWAAVATVTFILP
jgi:hypothetical protein